MNQLAAHSPELAEPASSSAAIGVESDDAPFVWQITCTDWRPAPKGSGDVVGNASFRLRGGMILSSCRIIRLRSGTIAAVIPKRAALKANELLRDASGGPIMSPVVSFATYAAWTAFSKAACRALRRFAPDALPNTAPKPETPPSEALGPAKHHGE